MLIKNLFSFAGLFFL